MPTDGSLIPCTNKSELTHVLEGLVYHADQPDNDQTRDTYDKDTDFIIDE